MDDLGDGVLAGGGDDVVRAGDVGIDVGLGGVVGIGDRDEGGEVEDGVAPGDGVVDGLCVADISEDDFEVVRWCGGVKMVEPSPGVEGVVEDHGADGGAAAEEGLGEVGADEAFGAGDEGCAFGDVHWAV